MIDVIQEKKKYKKPYIRKWFHGKGDDTYSQALGTKKGFKALAQATPEQKEDYYVAYQGKEYGADEFMKKYPKIASIKDKVRNTIAKKKKIMKSMIKSHAIGSAEWVKQQTSLAGGVNKVKKKMIKKRSAKFTAKDVNAFGSAEWVKQQTQI